MTTKHFMEDIMQVSETTIDESVKIVAVSVPYTQAGSTYIEYYVYNPEESYLCGEDYPSLVEIWNNQEDDIYDTI